MVFGIHIALDHTIGEPRLFAFQTDSQIGMYFKIGTPIVGERPRHTYIYIKPKRGKTKRTQGGYFQKFPKINKQGIFCDINFNTRFLLCIYIYYVCMLCKQKMKD